MRVLLNLMVKFVNITFLGSKLPTSAYFWVSCDSTMNLILSQKVDGTWCESGESCTSAGSATVVQRTLREHSALPQHSGSWQSVRPSVNRRDLLQDLELEASQFLERL